MIVFICGKCRIEDYERYKAVETDITDAGHKAVNPLKFIQMVGETNSEKIANINIALLDLCDSIYLLGDAQDSPFANRMIGYAIAKEMTFLNEVSLTRYYHSDEMEERKEVRYED